MIKYRVILSKKNALTIFIRYFENDTILGITIYRQTICSALVKATNNKYAARVSAERVHRDILTRRSWECDPLLHFEITHNQVT